MRERVEAGKVTGFQEAPRCALGFKVRAAISFTVDDLVESGLPRDRVEAVLEELSLSARGLRPGDYRGLFDESPLVERPFFEFGGRYVLAVPGMVLRDAVALLVS